LRWLNHFGTVEVSPLYPQRKGHIFTCTVFQATIFDLYNKKDVYTYGELAELTKIPKKNLDANLVSMCNPKIKVLNKEIGKPKFESDSEKLSLNLEFKNPNLLLNLRPQGAAKKIDGSELQGQKRVEEDLTRERSAQIDGAVVKIMKTHKNEAARHQDLVNKTMQLITIFRAQPPQIKIRIEELILQGYMRRDDAERTKYWYIA